MGGGGGNGRGPCIIILPPRPGRKGALGGGLKRPSFTGGLTPAAPVKSSELSG